MREIIFRGKTRDGNWIEGSLLKVAAPGGIRYLIFGAGFVFVANVATSASHAAVDPNTVGQFTGRYDRNGKRIFEGDAVVDNNIPSSHLLGGVVTYVGAEFVVHWKNYRTGKECYTRLSEYEPSEIDVIGNIYDKIEDLKGGEQNG